MDAKTRIELRRVHDEMIAEMVETSVKELSKSLDLSQLDGS